MLYLLVVYLAPNTLKGYKDAITNNEIQIIDNQYIILGTYENNYFVEKITIRYVLAENNSIQKTLVVSKDNQGLIDMANCTYSIESWDPDNSIPSSSNIFVYKTTLYKNFTLYNWFQPLNSEINIGSTIN